MTTPSDDALTARLARGRQLLDEGHLTLALAQWHGVVRDAIDRQVDGSVAWPCLLYAMSLDPHGTPSSYLDMARQHGDRLTRRARQSGLPPFERWHLPYAPTSDAPWRVGLVSGNLHQHPVGYFLESLLRASDPRRIQWFAYANRHTTDAHADALTARIRPLFTHWEPIAQQDDPWVARRIHAHGLHVLIDLDGCTDGNRLPLFAWQAAPVQASWLGHWASTGLPAMDFVLADPVSLPESARVMPFTEAIERLPGCRFCFSAPTPSPAVTPLPALRNGFVTFASFQSAAKIHDAVLRCWARVLAAVPGSRLRLASRLPITAALANQWTARLAAAGLPPGRVDLAQPCTREAYLAAHAEVDIVLDTFPVTGGTTTCEALWMGVPTLTLAGPPDQGHPLISRQGASLMQAAGLPDWVADDEADMVCRAAAHARDLPRLARLRLSLRDQVQRSALMDAPRFARALEAALLRMWQRKWGPGPAPGRAQ